MKHDGIVVWFCMSMLLRLFYHYQGSGSDNMLGSSFTMASLTTSCTISAIALGNEKWNIWCQQSGKIGDCMAHSSTTWEFQPIIFFETSFIQYAADQVPQCGGSSDEGGVSHQGCLHFQSKSWLLPLRPWPEERKAEPEVPLMAVASLRHHQ